MTLRSDRITTLMSLLVMLTLHGWFSSHQLMRRVMYHHTHSNAPMSSSSLDYFRGSDDDMDRTPLWIANPKQDAFAACLMVMDDNHRLAEWLPYHYLTMPLRHVVILVDEQSTTLPDDILNKWRPYMTIETWTASQHLPPVPPVHGPPQFQAVLTYLKRQSIFYHTCATHLQAHNWTWTSFHDVDEFYVAQPLPPVLASKNATNNTTTDKNQNNDEQEEDEEIPSVMGQPGIILDTIRQVKARMANGTMAHHDHYVGPCIPTFRILFGVNESSMDDVVKDVPNTHKEGTIHPERFDTLRFRYFSNTPQIGKSLYNVQYFPGHEFNHSQIGAHQLVPTCPHPYYARHHVLRIHHYLGSWESYTSRPTDPRINNPALLQTKAWSVWQQQGLANRGPNDDVRPWVASFVQHFGLQRAAYLLADVGIIVSSGINNVTTDRTTQNQQS